MTGDKSSFFTPEQNHRENRRLDALARTGLLDAPALPGFERLAQLAAFAFQAPISVVSLVSRDQTVFVARVGLDACSAPNSAAFCEIVARTGAPLIVLNTARDARFKDNPLVTGAPYVRFYAGAPVEAPCGTVIGAVAVLDTEPRFRWDDAHARALSHLAGIASDTIASGLALDAAMAA